MQLTGGSAGLPSRLGSRARATSGMGLGLVMTLVLDRQNAAELSGWSDVRSAYCMLTGSIWRLPALMQIRAAEHRKHQGDPGARGSNAPWPHQLVVFFWHK